MAKISFRQGIVSHPKNTLTGTQTFLRIANGNVDIIIDANTSAEPVLVAFAHQDTDYLYAETLSVIGAWQDCLPGTNNWLYWEIDINTGELIRGKTDREPIYLLNPPAAEFRVIGQMWFDLSNNTFKVWQGAIWREAIRVMAAKVMNGTTISSLSVNADTSRFDGTQVGQFLSQRQMRNVGSLVYNSAGKAIKSGINNQFFTTEDSFLTGVPTGASQRINNNIIMGTALCPIAAFQIVEYNEYDRICLADARTQGLKLYGIVEFDVETQEVTNLIAEGIIFNDAWDWEAQGVNVNSPLYIDVETNFLTPINSIAGNSPVAITIGRQEVYFAPRLFPQVNVQVGGNNGLTAEQLEALTNTVNLAAENATFISENGSLFTGLSDKIINNATDIEELKDTANSITQSFRRNFISSEWSTIGQDSTLITPHAIHNRQLGIYYDVMVLNSDGRRLSVDFSVNTTTGDVSLFTRGEVFSGSIIIT